MQVWEYPREKRAVTYEDVNDVYKDKDHIKIMVPKAGKGLTEKCAGVVILIKKYEQAY